LFPHCKKGGLLFEDVCFFSLAFRAFKGVKLPSAVIRFNARQSQQAAAFDTRRTPGNGRWI